MNTMANEKSKAEQYRDERKARIAKSAKKNAHSMEKRNTAKKVVGKVISIVLCAVIVLGIVGFSLNYYGALQRVIKIGGVAPISLSPLPNMSTSICVPTIRFVIRLSITSTTIRQVPAMIQASPPRIRLRQQRMPRATRSHG